MKALPLTFILLMMLSTNVSRKLKGYFVAKLEENGDRQSELETEILA